MRVFCSRKIILTLTLTLLYGAARIREEDSHSKPCSLSLRSVTTQGTEISVRVRVKEEMKNDKLITLKLTLTLYLTVLFGAIKNGQPAACLFHRPVLYVRVFYNPREFLE